MICPFSFLPSVPQNKILTERFFFSSPFGKADDKCSSFHRTQISSLSILVRGYEIFSFLFFLKKCPLSPFLEDIVEFSFFHFFPIKRKIILFSLVFSPRAHLSEGLFPLPEWDFLSFSGEERNTRFPPPPVPLSEGK